MWPITTNKILIDRKKNASQLKKPEPDAYQQIRDNSKKNEKKDKNDLSQTIWTSVSRYKKLKSSLGHKTVFNYAMLYLIAVMTISPEFLENTKNNQIKL